MKIETEANAKVPKRGRSARGLDVGVLDDDLNLLPPTISSITCLIPKSIFHTSSTFRSYADNSLWKHKPHLGVKT